MCLSKVYRIHGDESELYCKNIQHVRQTESDDELVFTDIMGISYTLHGKIRDIDLVENTINVEEA